MKPSTNLKNNFYFKRILKFCSLTLRSRYEVESQLEKFSEIEENLKAEIIEYFIKIKVVLEDVEFIDYYLQNLSSTKGYNFNQLYLKLSKKVGDKNLLKQKLNSYFKENGESQIQLFIERNKRKLERMESDMKRIRYLSQKGFNLDLVKKYVKTITYNK